MDDFVQYQFLNSIWLEMQVVHTFYQKTINFYRMCSPCYIRPPFDDFSHDKQIFADHPSAE